MAGCHRILVTIPDRLGKTKEALSAIASVVASVAQQKGSASNELAHVEYTFDDIAAWPQPGRDPEAISFFEHSLPHSEYKSAVSWPRKFFRRRGDD